MSCIFVGKYLSKKDGKNIASLFGILLIIFMAISLISNNLILSIPTFLICSLLQPFVILYFYQSYLIKGRIIGVANDIIVNQEVSAAGAYAICYLSGCFGGGLIIPLIVSCIIAISGVVYTRKSEDQTTKVLVDYLSKNE